MPDFQFIAPATRKTTRKVTIGIVDLTGNTRNVILKNLGAGVTDAQVNALRTAIGNASNGGVYFDSKEVIQAQAPRDSRAFSDPHSSVSMLGVLVFDHPNPQVESVDVIIPAIDLGKITSSGDLNMDDGEMTAIVNAALPILNDSNPFTGDYYFSHGYFSDRKGSKKVYTANIPNVVDPRGTPDPQS